MGIGAAYIPRQVQLLPSAGWNTPISGLPANPAVLQLLGAVQGTNAKNPFNGQSIFYDPSKGSYYKGTDAASAQEFNPLSMNGQIAEAPGFMAKAAQLFSGYQAQQGQKMLQASQPAPQVTLAGSLLSGGGAPAPAPNFQTPQLYSTLQPAAQAAQPQVQTAQPQTAQPQQLSPFFAILQALQNGNFSGQAGAGVTPPQTPSATGSSNKGGTLGRNSGRSPMVSSVPTTATSPSASSSTSNYSQWTPQQSGPWWRGGQNYA